MTAGIEEATTEPAVLGRPERPYVGIRREVTDGIPALVDRAFPELFGWLGERGISPAAAPVIRVWEADGGRNPTLLEVGVPVAEELEAEGEVRVDALPAGDYLTMLHIGPYRSDTLPDLSTARDRLVSYAVRNDLGISRPIEGGVVLPCAVDQMLFGPESTPDFELWRTELAYLVVDG